MKKPPTLQDVAEALGLHKSTVSLALSGKGNVSAATRARVRSAARDLGYHPNPLAQQLARGYRDDLVCLFTGVLDVGLTTAKILAIQQSLSARALDVPIYIESNQAGAGGSMQVTQVRQLRQQRPRAVICASHRLDAAVFRELAPTCGKAERWSASIPASPWSATRSASTARTTPTAPPAT